MSHIKVEPLEQVLRYARATLQPEHDHIFVLLDFVPAERAARERKLSTEAIQIFAEELANKLWSKCTTHAGFVSMISEAFTAWAKERDERDAKVCGLLEVIADPTRWDGSGIPVDVKDLARAALRALEGETT